MKNNFTKNEIKEMLSLESPENLKELFSKAYKVKEKFVGTKVFFRGIIEFSNICEKDCYYCGIRKSNKNVERYLMKEEEIINSAKWAFDADYGSIVLQSGERSDKKFIDDVEKILYKIKEITNNKLGITISLGEQTKETYKRWFKAGAHRYLLRIETSNKELYSKLHPKNHSFENRLNCLKTMREIGYQVGTGVMCGLPFQTVEDLANDILFFKEFDIDMIGMGPFIPHKDTKFANLLKDFDKNKKQSLEMGLKMIAVTRLVLQDVNIASTTALQALNDVGRELGLMAGANIIMPNITDTKYRGNYQLYENKPCLDENSTMCKDCLGGRINKIGEEIGYNEWGDSPHFKNRL